MNVCGGMRLMSVPEPPPGEVGFINVVSIKVQFSPFNPQLPNDYARFSVLCLAWTEFGTHLSVSNL